MNYFKLDNLRALSPENINSLKERAQNGDNMAQYEIAMCVIYSQIELGKGESIPSFLTYAVSARNEMALLLMGYIYEHAIGVSKDYAKAVEYYTNAYDVLNNIHPSDTKGKKATGNLKELEKRYDQLVKQVAQVVSIKNYCLFKDGRFLFPWTDETRKSIEKLLPPLSNDIVDFSVLHDNSITDLNDDSQGRWEFCYQDTLLMPLEVMKALAARDYLERFFEENGFQHLPADPFFNNALGRCLIDDDDAYDNDYIIGGLLNMAGHEGDPLWQYRVGLWYEFCNDNLEPKTAAYWYEKAKGTLPAAKTALNRLKDSLQYRILDNIKEGTSKDCQSLYTRSSKNPQNSISWIVESALRGDVSAMQRLEQKQFSPKGKSSVFDVRYNLEDIKPFYTLWSEEASNDKVIMKQWSQKMQKEKDEYRKRIEEEARRKAEEERKRLEAIRKAEDAKRKAEEEAIRKAKEAEEAKRRAEEEAKRKAEEEAIRKAKEAEEARRRAEEEAVRKAKAAEEAKRRAEEDAIRKAKEAEEAKRRAEEEAIKKAKAAEEAKRRAEEEAKRKAEAKRRAELRAIEEKEAKRKETILFIIPFVTAIIPWIWICIGDEEFNSDISFIYRFLLGFVVALGVGAGSLIVITGDEKQWKTILYRGIFAVITGAALVISIISGTFGISTLFISIFTGLFCVALVGMFTKPSALEK